MSAGSLSRPHPPMRDAENDAKAGNCDFKLTRRPVGKPKAKPVMRAVTPELDPHIAALLEQPEMAFAGVPTLPATHELRAHTHALVYQHVLVYA